MDAHGVCGNGVYPLGNPRLKQLLNAVFAITNNQDIAVVGLHSLPLWLYGLHENSLIDRDNQIFYPQDTHVELCYYGESASVDDMNCLIHSVFSIDSMYSKRNNISVSMVDSSELLPGWITRCKKFRMGRHAVNAMHPSDLYHYVLPFNPDYAKMLVEHRIVNPDYTEPRNLVFSTL